MSAAPSVAPRVVAARRRAERAKLLLGGAAVALFAVTAGLARVQVPGHRRHALQSLRAPDRFVRSVRESFLDAGLIAPTEAPADAVTGTS